MNKLRNFSVTIVLLLVISGCKNFNDSILSVKRNSLLDHKYLDQLTEIGGDGYEYGLVFNRVSGQNYLASSTYQSFGNTTDILLVKFDDKCNISRSMIYSGTNKDLINVLVESFNSQILLIGKSKSLFHTIFKDLTNPEKPFRPIVIEVNHNGNLNWAKVYEGNGIDFIASVPLKNIGKQLIVGSHNSSTMILLKLDATGEIVNSIGLDQGVPSSIINLTNGFLILSNKRTGEKRSANLVILNDEGEPLSVLKIFRTGYDIRFLNGVGTKNQNTYLIASTNKAGSDGNKMEDNIILIALNEKFEIKYAKSFYFEDNYHLNPLSITTINDDHLLISGYVTNSETKSAKSCLILADEAGTLLSYNIGSLRGDSTIDYSTQVNDKQLVSVGVLDRNRDGKANIGLYSINLPLRLNTTIGLELKNIDIAAASQNISVQTTKPDFRSIDDITAQIYTKELPKY